ncbi:MAG: hypothetical protein JJT78_02865 [Leptospira sp.]|jgi:hypothetical protein|nr:hypothetical protein [Leptospira sp.]
MIQLTYFELELQNEFQLSDRDARRMDRAVHDISESVGMSKSEVFDFIKFGCEEEMKSLEIDYDWKAFFHSITFRLKKQS